MSKKDKGIKISPEHGLNPSIQLCFWCKEPMGVALLGKLPGDKEAPHDIILNYHPCDKCKSQWDQGVTVLEVTKTCPSEGAPPFQNNLWVTGRYVVLKTDDEDSKGDILRALKEDFEEILHRVEETQDE